MSPGRPEFDQLEASWALPSVPRCVHCGERITRGDGPGHTWFGPLPAPGQDRLTVPVYHLARNACRLAGGLPPMARPLTGRDEAADPRET